MFLSAISAFFAAPRRFNRSVQADRLTVARVMRGRFLEHVPVSGRVQYSKTSNSAAFTVGSPGESSPRKVTS